MAVTDIKTVLVVEDEESLFNPLSKKLELEGINVAKSVDGEDGLRQALDNHPDLILLDIFMPKMDGMTLLEKLRKDDWGKDAKVIIFTNVALNDDMMSQVKRDMPLEYLVKSDYSLDQIVEKVKKALNS